MNQNIATSFVIILIIVITLVALCFSIKTVREYMTNGKPPDSDDPALTALIRPTVVDNSIYDVCNDPADYLILVTAACSPYMDWQSLAAYEKARQIWPEAQIVRLLHCSNKDRERYKYKNIMPSFYSTDCSVHPRTRDEYPPLNRPVSIKEFFDAHPLSEIKQQFIVIMDSDTLLRKRMNYFPVYKNRPVAQSANILMSKMYTAADIAFKDPERIKTLPLFDMGSPYILHKEDAARLAPEWVRLTNVLRESAYAREYLGWTIEMSSYILAAASVGLETIVRSDLQSRWPYTDTSEDVASYHYDLDQEKDGHKWSKRHYMTDIIDSDTLMDVSNCPNEHVQYILTSINEALLKWREMRKKK